MSIPRWYFNKDDRLEQGPGPGSKSTAQQAALYTEANLYATLMGGFTTVQSVGAAGDADFREMIAKDRDTGPAPALVSRTNQRETAALPTRFALWWIN